MEIADPTAGNEEKSNAGTQEGTPMSLYAQAYPESKITHLNSKELADFDEEIADADSPEEITALLKQLGTSEEHIQFLLEYGNEEDENGVKAADNIEKCREYYAGVPKYDYENNTHTSAFIPEEAYRELAKTNPDQFASTENVESGVKHRASLTKAITNGLTSVIDWLQTKGLKPEDVSFFDYGTGTGKPVLIALSQEFNFKSGTGVDYFEPVLVQARINAKALGLIEDEKEERPDDKVKFVFADATQFKEFNGINVVYMYNPFDENVMKKVEQNLRKHAGKTVVIYNKPLYADLFVDKNWTLIHEQNMQKDENGDPIMDPDLQTQIFAWGFDNGGNGAKPSAPKQDAEQEQTAQPA